MSLTSLSFILLFASWLPGGDFDVPRPRPAIAPVPVISAAAAIVVDARTGDVLYEKNANEQRPIASLTKLMTAQVFLDTQPDWQRIVAYNTDDDTMGARVMLHEGETASQADLLASLLVGSANNAAYALVRESPYTRDTFVDAMNAKAASLGLAATVFADPSGLFVNNTSTAREVATFTRTAFARSEITHYANLRSYEFTTRNTDERHVIKNLNGLLRSNLMVRGTKTGYLDEAGYCLASWIRNDNGEGLIIVVLGEPTARHREDDTRALADWAFDRFALSVFVRK